MNVTSSIQQIDRQIKGILRGIDTDNLAREEKQFIQKLKLACNEVKLDLRDYEYAQTREEQLKWAKLARHNLIALERYILELPAFFLPVDVAELSAKIDELKGRLR
ncbi:hypothetical protein JNM87_01725 [Candidatus Saccharibacteria bacterium]|nr:hypothetical protein [Candidatus Saccharibacteria bacterium]